MNSKEKVEFLQGQFLQTQGLAKLNQYLAKNNQNFHFELVDKPKFELGQKTIGVVISGKGKVLGDLNTDFEANDLLFFDRESCRIDSDNFKILTITGENLFENRRIVKQANLPILPSTLGGTRKFLKANEGKFNLDVHLIWVDGKNIKIPHYHAKVFELYLVESGVGEILLKKPEMGGWLAKPKLKPGVFVLVPPNTVHCAQGEDLEIAVIGIPAFYSSDSYIVE